MQRMRKSASGTRIARNVRACMKAEGFPMTEKTRACCVAVASGKQSADQLVKSRLAAYAVKK